MKHLPNPRQPTNQSYIYWEREKVKGQGRLPLSKARARTLAKATNEIINDKNTSYAYAPPSSLCMSGCGPETIDVAQSNRSHHLPKAATTKQKSEVKIHHQMHHFNTLKYTEQGMYLTGQYYF